QRNTIVDTEEQRIASLQGALKCGTNCGSCLPEVRRLVRMAMPARQPA
ncbi:MAG: nitrate reductase, partial [Rhodoferax sp.]|nr:nitrate reductase [Rhodoferax sp.]